MSKKHKLSIQKEPFASIAIICPEGHQKLSWLLNNSLRFEFSERLPTHEIIDENLKDFPVFIDNSSNSDFAFKLIKNKFEGKVLLKSMPNIDFILKVEGNTNDLYIKELAKRIKSTPGVLGAIQLEDRMKDISTLDQI
ncbi:MAG TPA: IPExxxVDY family protein [Tenuifilaceae bacterium]|nr:IPExxxVDY family protein [Tenuifilaceae bacterium]HPE17769.1 IPExxxVDY family protein [Tenuifilaceae bacterium]HPJ45028.1 IPExxxVDY family protein [Tenuifilaceae bacterium]HPQ34148.1 IPExxxVDY family protein [Tenuifilaceae bacterium]HRX67152.1 IPExxxVDY family protein [Tenuifilaceae bacterium]